MLRRIKEFDYLKPATLSEAISLYNQYRGQAKIFAGGTDLLVQMKHRQVTPKCLINIKGIPGLDKISLDGDLLRIGCLVTHKELSNSDIIKKKYPVLAEASEAVGVLQTRIRGTLAGNICNASPSADTAPALLALDARIKISSSEGERTVKIEEFFTGPFKSILKDNEIVTEIEIPLLPEYSSSNYLWLSKIAAWDESLVGVGTVIALNNKNDQVCSYARIGLGSVAPTPIRALKTEEFLMGKRIDEEICAKAGEMAALESHPRSRANYRREMVKVLVKNSLSKALKEIIG